MACRYAAQYTTLRTAESSFYDLRYPYPDCKESQRRHLEKFRKYLCLRNFSCSVKLSVLRFKPFMGIIFMLTQKEMAVELKSDPAAGKRVYGHFVRFRTKERISLL